MGGRTIRSHTPPSTRSSYSSTSATMKVLAILYDGGKAAEEEPRLLGTTENKVGQLERAVEVVLLISFIRVARNCELAQGARP